MHNPFLNKKYETPYETIPFEHIAFEHIEPALLEGMKRELADHERVVTNPETPTFDNTLIDHDADHTLSKAQEVMGTYLSVNTDDAVEELAERMQPLLSE
ncbi:MAG: peptidase M3, partial [Bacteroidaceae bacterium]|nr:peptidase M3 [Bacteroidaceae bacterium]